MTASPSAQSFPQHYPTSCPPSEATAASGKVFRLVENPPSGGDLDSQYDQRGHGDCSARSVSFFTTLEGAKRMRSGYPQHSHKQIAELSLDSAWGLMRIGKPKGGKTHVDLWLYATASKPSIASFFCVVAEVTAI